MTQHDLGYYVDVVLRRDQEMSLFPEFYRIFRSFTLEGALSQLKGHKAYPAAIKQVAEAYEADPTTLEHAVQDVFSAIIQAESGNQFDLVFEFIYYFGGTRVDVPRRKDFDRLVRNVTIYYRVVTAAQPEEEARKLASEGDLTVDQVKAIVDQVAEIVDDVF